uniref:Peptidylprolyl isomerase n=1 Tax=Gongylonema pulchrum TaxID=637853 RepID=A0A183EYR0_9BILA
LVNSADLDAAAVAAMSKGEEFPTVDASLTGGHENVVS